MEKFDTSSLVAEANARADRYRDKWVLEHDRVTELEALLAREKIDREKDCRHTDKIIENLQSGAREIEVAKKALIQEFVPKEDRENATPHALLTVVAHVVEHHRWHHDAENVDYVRNVEIERDEAVERVKALEKERDSPHISNWLHAVRLEAIHQRHRWGVENDAGKAPGDWFWLVGYLAGKALQAAVKGDTDKALHHTISTGAALLNWHAHMTGDSTVMRPGIEPPKEACEHDPERRPEGYMVCTKCGCAVGLDKTVYPFSEDVRGVPVLTVDLRGKGIPEK